MGRPVRVRGSLRLGVCVSRCLSCVRWLLVRTQRASARVVERRREAAMLCLRVSGVGVCVAHL